MLLLCFSHHLLHDPLLRPHIMTLIPPPSQQTPNSPHRIPNRRVLETIAVVAGTLGGAASFIS
ncbi:hypothetical protein DY000_02049772 [Brassica cretica]|uniref:Uncharacterized protein n=1 Tax=Brassica cretica TaxID=69181 RepID=A0ABQ7ERG4_BRACR|nr:hypothetical protein DY000_02049772 [Brassica cretica]